MVNISQAAGVGPSGPGIPRVTTSQDDTAAMGVLNSASPFTTSGTSLTIPIIGKVGAGCEILAGAVATVIFEYSADGGVTFGTAIVVYDGAQVNGAQALGGTAHSVHFVCGEHWTHVRIRVTAYTSGSSPIFLRATSMISPLAVGALSSGAILLDPPVWVTNMGYKALTGAPAAQTITAKTGPVVGDVYGRLRVRQHDTWAINHVPAAATAATISQAAGAAGVKNVCTSVSITLSNTTAPTVAAVQFNLRDGATGAGTILQAWKLSIPGVAGECRVLTLSNLWIEGTAATAMTLETAAAPGTNTFATVAMTGTITQ